MKKVTKKMTAGITLESLDKRVREQMKVINLLREDRYDLIKEVKTLKESLKTQDHSSLIADYRSEHLALKDRLDRFDEIKKQCDYMLSKGSDAYYSRTNELFNRVETLEKLQTALNMLMECIVKTADDIHAGNI